ncbi:O-antigen ligase family protein [Patescibacteria group bacterium]|nr:O-antigen ligase family protein [Patescibacteria group bacterium]
MKKNIIILLTELIAIFLMVFNILPRELGLFVTGLLIFYFIFSPLEDSLWVFIASIPLFVALPITESFDTMANWRILLIVLFLVLFFKQGISIKLLKNNFKYYQAEYLTGIFLLIAIASLFVADDLFIGVKKIIFLINIFLLYIIIRNLIYKNKEIIPKIMNAMKVAIGLVLGVGFLQLIMVFFMNLHKFWYLWDRNVINVFYGIDLSNLLSYSNTWFSYYSYQLPTLRMFSIFPDSHSFAFFCILSIPFFLTAIFTHKDNLKIKKVFLYFIFISCLLAIIFSGSRGAWVSALGVFLIFLFIALLCFLKKIIFWKKQIQLILGCFIIFFILFPIASVILFMPQYIELGRDAISNASLFERTRSIIDFTEMSIKGRLEIWQRTVDSIIIRPLLGVGIGNFPLILNEDFSFSKKGSSAHNLYLDFAAEIGVFALFVLLVVFWKILKRAWYFFQGKIKGNSSYLNIWIGFFVIAFLWILSYSLFDVVLLNDKVLLFFMANIAILYSYAS